ncbi:MAG: outer membrane beta-barrel protein [Crocinitomicaceae bacterium]
MKLQNKLGASLHYDFKKHSVKIGFTARNVLIDENQNLFVHSVLKQNNTTVLPSFMYKFKISKNSEFRINANANSSLPDINFLQPIANNANPNSIFIGNTNLKPSYTALLILVTAAFYNPMSGGYLWTGLIHLMVGIN